jgi:TolB-like protein/DNA-binding winged helix-turn-helix (wHTH) protein/Tfp pilus assembly protein PilF
MGAQCRVWPIAAMVSLVQPRRARFGVFEVDFATRQLRKSGFRIRLQDQPFQVLELLLRTPGQIVTRDELKEKLWSSDTFVAFDDGLNTAIKKVRAALSDTADSPRFVETVPRVGYRFIAPVSFPDEAPEGDRQTASAGEVPPEVTSPNPGERPAVSSRSFSADPLSWRRGIPWAVAGVLLLAIIGLAARRTGRSIAASQDHPIHAIAVLPLQNTSADPGQQYMADGMTDEIITDLAKLAGPKVISRTSAMQYKGTAKTVPQIARELRVGAIVEGSVERSGDLMRVRIQLIDAATDQHLWAEVYDRQLKDVLQLEADVAKDIAQQIQLHLTPGQEQSLARSRITNPQAFQDYLLGRQYWAIRTDESLHKAVEYFNRAIQEDPGDARSYAGLAHCYIVFPMLTQATETETAQKAREAAKKALALDESVAEAHLAMAEIEFYQDWNFAGAEKEFRRTLELNPNYATGHQWYGEFLSVFGRHAEALREIETALALDPLSAIVHHQAGQSFQQARQYDRAIEEYQQAVKLNPNLYVSYEAMFWAYRRQGKFEAAARAMQGGTPYWSPSQGMGSIVGRLPSAYAHGGREGFLRQSIEMHRHFRDSALYLARDYMDLGDRERAYGQLDRAFAEKNQLRLWILIDPEFDSMRSDSRFRTMVRQIENRKSES